MNWGPFLAPTQKNFIAEKPKAGHQVWETSDSISKNNSPLLAGGYKIGRLNNH